MAGFKLYYKSRFDGKRCVAVVTKSHNRKTGRRVLQVWYMPVRVSPCKAVKSGRDRTVCGTCPFKGGNGCYVVSRAPQSVWRWLRNCLPLRKLPVSWKGWIVRWGAWGDPASMSRELFEYMRGLLQPRAELGYTHAWKRTPWLRAHCMASVEDPLSAWSARERGWKTFRIHAGGLLAPWESACPAERGLHCQDCRRCGGTGAAGPLSPVIVVHGHSVAKAAAKVVDLV